MSIPSMFPPANHAHLPNPRNPGFQGSSIPYHCNGQTQNQDYYNGEYRITREHNSSAAQLHSPSLNSVAAAQDATPAVPSTAAASGATTTTAAAAVTDDVVLMNLDTGNLVRDQQPNYTHKCDKCPFGTMDEMSLRMHYLQEHYDVRYMRDHIKKHFS